MGAALLGAGLLAGVSSMAFADDAEHDSSGVPVKVEFEDAGPGQLSLSVTGEAILSEVTPQAVPGQREFAGTLPTVTVTDNRDVGDIPAGAAWYVLGQSSDFEGDASQPDITADHLGWTPKIVDAGALGLVDVGDPVLTSMDAATTIPPQDPDNVGLLGQELFAYAADSAIVNPEGSWQANADLVLKIPSSTPAGAYASVLTLSLFE
jgi:hypothetical protein